jgi:RNase H-like domain found in reverse transcriptase
VLTKKRWTTQAFRFGREAEEAFYRVKDMLVEAATLTLMTEQDPLILYTDASTNAIAGVLMQVQNGKEHPCVFASHVLSDQATRWGIMELELYALVYCVKHLTPYSLRR